MEPNKMEEEFRKKLNAREIQPSDAAWDRLDAMLSVAENKKPKRNFRWVFIAAGLALFFAEGLFLFQQEKNTPEIKMTNPTVVTSGENQQVSGESNPIVSHEGISEIKKEVAVAENQTASKTKTNKKTAVKTTSDFQQQFVKEEIAEVSPQKEPEIQKMMVDAEKLLADSDKPKEKPQVKVSANSLLSSVEGELNQEFRETTLQRLNRNFKTVKTAVVNRNYQ
jgi:hypothetical protein